MDFQPFFRADIAPASKKRVEIDLDLRPSLAEGF